MSVSARRFFNYAQYIYCGNDEKGTRPPFTNDEVELIRQAIGKVDYADYVYCMIYSGFRPSEMLSLTIDACDAPHKTLTGGFKTEAGKKRIMTLSPRYSLSWSVCRIMKPICFLERTGRR